jgi:hypothetical protein
MCMSARLCSAPKKSPQSLNTQPYVTTSCTSFAWLVLLFQVVPPNCPYPPLATLVLSNKFVHRLSISLFAITLPALAALLSLLISPSNSVHRVFYRLNLNPASLRHCMPPRVLVCVFSSSLIVVFQVNRVLSAICCRQSAHHFMPNHLSLTLCCSWFPCQ